MDYDIGKCNNSLKKVSEYEKTHRIRKLFFNISESLRTLFLNNPSFFSCTILKKNEYSNYYISDDITIGFYCSKDRSKIFNDIELLITFPYNNYGILCVTQEINYNTQQYGNEKNHYNYDSMVSEIKNTLDAINTIYSNFIVCDMMDELNLD